MSSRDGQQYAAVVHEIREDLCGARLLGGHTRGSFADGGDRRPVVLVEVDQGAPCLELLQRAPRVAQLDDRVAAVGEADGQLGCVWANSDPLQVRFEFEHAGRESECACVHVLDGERERACADVKLERP
ncbi:MAG: hypothetical protein H0X28_04770 [Solirubrobacterales bacterium]|nr:hypothetical protein [Solirubrobacterales bacterium]